MKPPTVGCFKRTYDPITKKQGYKKAAWLDKWRLAPCEPGETFWMCWPGENGKTQNQRLGNDARAAFVAVDAKRYELAGGIKGWTINPSSTTPHFCGSRRCLRC